MTQTDRRIKVALIVICTVVSGGRIERKKK